MAHPIRSTAGGRAPAARRSQETRREETEPRPASPGAARRRLRSLRGAPRSDRGDAVYDTVADLIPNLDQPSPMVRLSERFVGAAGREILVKLEGFNPYGSIKDRVALAMLRGARPTDGQTLVEPSSGNTGIALAALANAAGIPIEIAVPEGVPEDKKLVLRLLGVQLWEAPDDLCPAFPSEGARGLVKSLVESPRYGGRYVSPNQYANPLNAEAHYLSTGPEIWKQTRGAVGTFYAGFGTCGTLTGVGRFLKERDPSVRIVGVEPARRDHRLPGMKRVSDLPDELVPEILDRGVIDEVIEVEDDEAYRAGVRLARAEGLLVGPTTGAILAAALRDPGAETDRPAVALSPDGAFKYLSAYAPYLEEGAGDE